MLLTAYLVGTDRIGVELLDWTRAVLDGNSPFKWEAAVSGGYDDITDIDNLDKWATAAGVGYKELRNKLIADYVGNWGTLTAIDKQTLVRHFAYPSAETPANLDLLYSQADRDKYKKVVMERLESICGCVVGESNITPGKYFHYRVDDAGVLDPQEILTDVGMA